MAQNKSHQLAFTMYKIIGADGKEYGPISTDQLRQWVKEGRINAQTKVRPDGVEEWQLLGTFPEFSAEFPPSIAPTTAGEIPCKTSALAITSLVLGILGLFSCGITAFFGLISGIIALVKIKNSQGRLAGSGLAIAGIVTSGIFLLMIPVFAAMLLPALAKAKERAQTITCINNVKQLSLAVKMYSLDAGDKFPSGTNWCDLIQTNVGMTTVYQCPANPGLRCGFAYNSKLADKKEGEVNSQTVMFFESGAGWNASGGPELFAEHKHSRTKIVIGYADGSVVELPRSQLDSLRWEP